MSAIPQVILLRQLKSLSSAIDYYRHPPSIVAFEPGSTEETLLHVKDPPRVRRAVEDEGGIEFQSYRLSVKAIREEFPREDESTADDTMAGNSQQEASPNDKQGNLTEGNSKENDQALAYMQVDPGCWVQLADSGLYQRAEDSLSGAAQAELAAHGPTDRYCSLLHGLGALYDRRSYDDVTGQRCELSYQSAFYASQSLEARRALIAACQEQPNMKGQSMILSLHKEKLATSLALVGQSLCNFALDGASRKMSAKEALIKAEVYLKEALAVRQEMNHRELAEAEKGMGYLYYCRGSVLLQVPPAQRGPYQVEAGDNPEALYLRALPFYFRSLSLYIERDGELVESSVRMTCNVAQVYQHLSVNNANYIEQAYQWYKLALERQQEAFGDGHQRTRRIKADLRDIEGRKRAFEANQEHRVQLVVPSRVAAEEEAKAAAARKVEADQLMDQFLAELREEKRAAEAKRGGQPKPPPKQHSASEL